MIYLCFDKRQYYDFPLEHTDRIVYDDVESLMDIYSIIQFPVNTLWCIGFVLSSYVDILYKLYRAVMVFPVKATESENLHYIRMCHTFGPCLSVLVFIVQHVMHLKASGICVWTD